MKLRKTGHVKSELTHTDKNTGKTTFHGEKVHQISHSDGGGLPLAMVKVSNGVTLSLGFQSVRMDVGVEMPWPVQQVPDDLRAGFDKAYEFIDNEIAERAQELDSLVRDLAKKYSR